jgi:pimeloyl-ACP methyl ester carboxylesterase
MHPLECRLERSGIPAFSGNHGVYSVVSFDVAMRLARERLKSIRKRYPSLTHLIVVGHSLGGLIALELYLEGAFRGLQVRLLTLGSPFQGTWAALLGWPFSRTARDMIPFFRRRPAAFEVAVPFLSIAGATDLLAPPARCQHPDADFLVFDTDHAGLLFRKEVFTEIRRFCQ